MKIMKVTSEKEGHADSYELEVPLHAVRLVNVSFEQMEQWLGGECCGMHDDNVRKFTIVTVYWEIMDTTTSGVE